MALTQNSLYRSRSLHEQTYLALRSAILSGEIGTGERLVETQLAETLDVSRTPIREAIRRLQQESLLTVDVDGGLYVTQFSLNDAINLYDCRIALERLSVVGVCENATTQQLELIEQSLLQAEVATQKQANQMDSVRLLELNCQFHQLLASSSGNPWLVSLLDHISNKITLIRLQTLKKPSEVTDVHDEHRQIYEALVRRDSTVAEQQITHHLLASQKRIVQIFQTNQGFELSGTDATKCPRCGSTDVSKNGRRSHKQNYICKQCSRQFLGLSPALD